MESIPESVSRVSSSHLGKTNEEAVRWKEEEAPRESEGTEILKRSIRGGGG